MREYTGPTELPKPPHPQPRPTDGWKELDEQSPCPACGEHLIQRYTRFVPMQERLTGIEGPEQLTLHGEPECRNACLQE